MGLLGARGHRGIFRFDVYGESGPGILLKRGTRTIRYSSTIKSLTKIN